MDVTKIESQSLKLNKEQFDLNEIVSNTIADYKNELKEGNSNIKLELVSKGDEVCSCRSRQGKTKSGDC